MLVFAAPRHVRLSRQNRVRVKAGETVGFVTVAAEATGFVCDASVDTTFGAEADFWPGAKFRTTGAFTIGF